MSDDRLERMKNLPACWPRRRELSPSTGTFPAAGHQLIVKSANSFSWPSRLTKQRQENLDG